MTNPRTGYPEGYLIYLVKQVESGLRRPFDEYIAEQGISTGGYTALTVLQSRPGITSSELARRSFVRAQTMAETVTGLIDAGFVRREKDPGHGRQFLLYITELGTERVAALAPDVMRLESQMTQALGDGETVELVRVLRACRDALVELSRTPSDVSAVDA
ncbi:MarR family winged helix-turn-helix transcriptional regulator [Parafrigoribacterium soli]|uniref:MarR family winged helix-turn-helix transcriptional regulator n=1 Tax=Parafrigoribacterium soli TaxID=3144663 RepID=UPI0032EC8B15